MLKFLYTGLFVLCFYGSYAQISTDPAFPKADESITFTIDVSGTAMQGYTGDVWVWTWISKGCASNCDAPTNVNPATTAQSAALMTRSGGDPDVYTITFTPTTFFGKTADQFEELGLLLKGQDWSDGQTPDYNVTISSGGLDVAFISPSVFPLFVNHGETVEIVASSSEASDFTLKIDGSTVKTTSGTTEIAYSEVAGGAGKYHVQVIANDGIEEVTDEFYFVVRSVTEIAAKPVGVIAGINYDEADQNKATLCLQAPMKSSAYVVGDFTDWEIDPTYQMKKDGEYFWLEITGLVSGQEYAFQYLVDEEVYVADPYADKVLDPDDQYIPESTYPGLMDFPAQALKDKWYFNRLSVLQTGQAPYAWQTTSYTKPERADLVIYELLVRDFFAEGEKSYENLIDTLSYLSDLGINAIELMPIMEFNGNESWGYNPTFMFAPDKFYGTKNKFKEFIDKAHEKGIAVILDIAMNHNDIPAPYAMMYFDFNQSKPTADNPWFNTSPTHPYNVFFDFNHESAYTQQLLDSINHYWLNEYKVDGFRFDLSKGFTQKYSGGDVGQWSAYDISRINLLKRMANEIWAHTPDAYVILEHFADNTEEKELAGYGMMLWGNLNHAYTQSAMGFNSDSNVDWGYYATRDWSEPNLITYMESHDEERMMYKTNEFGNSSGSYDITVTDTGLERMKVAAAFFYTIPGPKMLWQFGEVGYDKSINTCSDGSVNNDCRVSSKPIPWNNVEGLDYNHDEARLKLQGTVAEIMKLRNNNDVFKTTDVTLIEDALAKQLILKNDPYTDSPTTAEDMNVVIVGNFDTESKNIETQFPHTGQWFSYFAPDATIDVSSTPASVELKPGKFRIYTDVQLPAPPAFLLEETVTGMKDRLTINNGVFPNPVLNYINVQAKTSGSNLSITNLKGQLLTNRSMEGRNTRIDVSQFPAGVYVIRIENKASVETFKFIKSTR